MKMAKDTVKAKRQKESVGRGLNVAVRRAPTPGSSSGHTATVRSHALLLCLSKVVNQRDAPRPLLGEDAVTRGVKAGGSPRESCAQGFDHQAVHLVDRGA